MHNTTEVARILGVESWRIRRLFETGTLPEPDRFAGRRIITPDAIPAIVDALRDRGWLPTSDEVAAP